MRQISSDGAAQTQKLIDAASQMKDAGWDFKGSAQGIDGNLGNAVGKLQGQVDQTSRAADAAKSAAKTAQSAVELSNRPWLKIDHQILSPLTFNIQRSGGLFALMTIQNHIENVGPGVALDVQSWEEVIPIKYPDLVGGAAILRRNQLCDSFRQRHSLPGYILFPHDTPMIQDAIMGPAMDAIKDAVAVEPSWLTGKVSFILVGCLVYRGAVEPKDAPAHETRFAYDLATPQENGSTMPFVNPTGIASDLRLVRYPLNGGWAAD
jgi:hypothetical protein